jgi:hypothetical protein
MTILIWLLLIVVIVVVATNVGSIFIPAPGKSSKLSRPIRIARGVWAYHLKARPEHRDPQALPVVYVAGPMFNPLSASEFLRQYDYCDVYFADAPHGAGFFRRSLNRLALAHVLLVERFSLARAMFVVGPGGGPIFARFMMMTSSSRVVAGVVFIDPSIYSEKGAAARFRKSVASENRLKDEGRLESWWSLSNRWRRGIEYFSRLSWIQTGLELLAVGGRKGDLRGLFAVLKMYGIPRAVAHGADNEAYPVEDVYETLVPDCVWATDFHLIPKGVQQDVHLMPYATFSVVRPIIRDLAARAGGTRQV